MHLSGELRSALPFSEQVLPPNNLIGWEPSPWEVQLIEKARLEGTVVPQASEWTWEPSHAVEESTPEYLAEDAEGFDPSYV